MADLSQEKEAHRATQQRASAAEEAAEKEAAVASTLGQEKADLAAALEKAQQEVKESAGQLANLQRDHADLHSKAEQEASSLKQQLSDLQSQLDEALKQVQLAEGASAQVRPGPAPMPYDAAHAMQASHAVWPFTCIYDNCHAPVLSLKLYPNRMPRASGGVVRNDKCLHMLWQ